eukprot:472303_1
MSNEPLLVLKHQRVPICAVQNSVQNLSSKSIDDAIEVEEEEKYQMTEVTEHNKIKNHTVKTMRTPEQIDEYLQNYLPPYIDSHTILKSFAFVIIPLLLNLYFIIDNFIKLQFHPDKQPTDTPKYLLISENIIVYCEFSGLMVFISAFLISLCCQSRSSIIKYILLIKSWSAFTLFYKLRPKALINHFTTGYKHQSEQHMKVNKKHQITRLKYILSELNNEINDSKTDLNIVHTKNMKRVATTLDKKIKKMENIMYQTINETAYTKNINHKLARHWSRRETLCCARNEYLYKTRNTASWIILIVSCLLLLFVGILALVLKLSQFRFINNTDISSITLSDFYEIYFLLAFCNQLWNMSDENEIRIDMIY